MIVKTAAGSECAGEQKAPIYGAFLDGRGGVRTCDLSRVKQQAPD